MPAIHCHLDPALSARLLGAEPLRYSVVPSPDTGLPAHVRSASALRRWQGRLAIVQDDVLALALRDIDGAIEPLLLPGGATAARVFDDRHGNKGAKPDLESALVLPDGRLLLFGSGAAAARAVITVLAPDAAPVLVQAAALYERLRANPRFSGAGLNIEGALLQRDRILFVQRGNAAAGRAGAATNALGAMWLDAFLHWLDAAGPAPQLREVRQFDLGSVDGTAFGFTDACALSDERIALLACAENSSGALTDGPVLGCRFGVLDGDALRMTDILDAQRRPSLLKLEGIEPAGDAPLRFDVVADVDDPDAPALLATLWVQGL